MIPLKEIRGKGIGIILDISHQDLLFIPEILNRKLKLKNKSNTNVIIESATITPSGNFTVLTNLPFQINIGDSAEIEVEWNGLLKDEALLELKASPCITDKSVKLGFYSALSQITIPYIEADPHLEIVIPISFSNVESKSYNGIRFFEANIFINPRMFFPVSVTSPFGTGSIIKNEVVDDKRIIGLRVAGDFPNNGIVAEIKGIAGLAETDTSSVVFDSVSIFWGKSVNVNFTSGFYRLIEICDDRFLYRINKNINIINIIPNPAEESSDLIFETNSEMNVDIEIYNSPGLLVYERKNIAALKGLNISTLDLSHLTTGYYRITIRNGNSLSNNNLIIIR